jgi:hypothetical protein
LVAKSSLPFTASVEVAVSAPGATLVTTLPPMSMVEPAVSVRPEEVTVPANVGASAN